MVKILARLQHKIFGRIKQKETGTFIGGLKLQLARSGFYFTIINFGLILITAYYTTIHPLYPTLPFGVFLACLIFLLVGLIIFEYTIIYPSEVAFTAHQIWKEKRNPLFKEITSIREDLDTQKGNSREILSKLQTIEKALENKI